jgi:hypothetical protein
MGYANTSFLHTCANERRRKTKIVSLDTDEGVIIESKEIWRHVVDFYKRLFGSSKHRGCIFFRAFGEQRSS